VDEFDQALEVDVLACSLRMEKEQSSDLMEYLALKLSGALPEDTAIVRGGWFLSSKRPVTELTLKLPDAGFQLTRDKRNHIDARILKIVRGVVLKTEEVSMEVWIMALAEALSKLAQKNSATRAALEKFVIG
jgi:hypothetical protein